jgi:hypothetical protein
VDELGFLSQELHTKCVACFDAHKMQVNLSGMLEFLLNLSYKCNNVFGTVFSLWTRFGLFPKCNSTVCTSLLTICMPLFFARDRMLVGVGGSKNQKGSPNTRVMNQGAQFTKDREKESSKV